jgi:hypothetical protein
MVEGNSLAVVEKGVGEPLVKTPAPLVGGEDRSHCAHGLV